MNSTRLFTTVVTAALIYFAANGAIITVAGLVDQHIDTINTL